MFSNIESLLLKCVNLPEEEDQELEDGTVYQSFMARKLTIWRLELKQMFYAPLSKTKLPASKKSIRK